MSKTTYIQKLQGQLVPDDYLAKVLAADVSCFGAVAAVKNTFEIVKLNEPPTLDELKGMQESFKDEQLFMLFGHDFPAGTIEEDLVQPYSVLNDAEGNPLIVAMLAGDFSNHEMVNGTFPSEFYAVENGMVDVIKQAYGFSKKDLVKTHEFLRDAFAREQFDVLGKSPSNIALLTKSGSLMLYGKERGTSAFGWGVVTDTHGYAEKAVMGTPPKEEEKPKNRLLRGSTPAVKLPEEAKKSVEEVVAEKPIEQQTAVLPVKMVQCPKEIKKDNKVRDYYDRNAGFIPTNWRDKPSVVSRKIEAKSFTEAALLAAQREAEDKAKVEAGTPVPTAESAPVVTPSLTAPQKETVISVVKKLGLDSKKVKTAEEVQSSEKKRVTFAQAVGVDFESILGWGFEDFRALVDGTSVAASILMVDMQGKIIRLQKELETMRKADTVDETVKTEADAPIITQADAPRVNRLQRKAS